MGRDKTFTAKNLYKVLSTVVRWYTLGTHLGIPLDQLEQIKQERFDIDEQKQGLIALILDNYQCDWTDICSALKQMNHTNLAREIRIKYCKSKVDSRNKAVAVMISLAIVTSCVIILVLSFQLNHNHLKCSMLDPKTEHDFTKIFGKGDLFTVKFIIDKMHIDPQECKDRYGFSPLTAAVRKDNLDVVKYLVEEWHWKIICTYSWSEMHEACYQGRMNLVRYFMTKNFTQCGRSLIEAAAFGGQIEILNYLVSRGYQVNCENHWSFMHEASFRGHLNILKFYAKVTHKDMCSLCVDEHGNNLLHAAAAARAESTEGQLLVLNYLIEEQKCDKTVRNSQGLSPLDKARQTHNQAIAEYLE